MADAAFEIADPVERLQDFFAELGGFTQDSFPHVGGGVGEAGQVIIAVDLEHVVEQETDIFEWGLVGRHPCSPGWLATLP